MLLLCLQPISLSSPSYYKNYEECRYREDYGNGKELLRVRERDHDNQYNQASQSLIIVPLPAAQSAPRP